MKKNISLSVWAFVFVIFESVICRYIGIGGVYPGVSLVFVICMAVLDDDMLRVTVMALLCGLFLDSIGGGVVGVNLFAFGISAVLCNYVTEKFFVPNIFVMLVSVILISLISRVIIFAFGFAIFGDVSMKQIFMPLILKQVIYNTCISFIVYAVLKKTVYTKKMYDRR